MYIGLLLLHHHNATGVSYHDASRIGGRDE
nr:MAG TPA: hypothetical protein [Caudoviricetes sp.]